MVLPCVVVGIGLSVVVGLSAVVIGSASLCGVVGGGCSLCCTCSTVYFAVLFLVQICLDQCFCAFIMFVNCFSHPELVEDVTCARSGFLVLCALAACTESACFVPNVLSH